MMQSESCGCVIPNRGVVQPREGSPGAGCCGGDPSLRLKTGSARDDAACKGSKLSQCSAARCLKTETPPQGAFVFAR